MKKTILILFITFFTGNFISAQFDIKGGFHASLPFGIFFSGEYPLFKDIGLEIGIVGNPGITLDQTHISGTALLFNARYYFSPKLSIDGWFTGFYLRPFSTQLREERRNFNFFSSGIPIGSGTSFPVIVEKSRDSGAGIGLMFGKKIVRKNRYFFEFSIGLGRNFGRRLKEVEVPGFSSDRVEVDLFYNLAFGWRLN